MSQGRSELTGRKGPVPADVFVSVISNLNAEQGAAVHADFVIKADYRGKSKVECVNGANLPTSMGFSRELSHSSS